MATEALYRVSVARGYFRPINHGQVYIFCLAIATIMLLAKKHGFEEDPLSSIIKICVGAEESKRRRRRGNDNSSAEFEEQQLLPDNSMLTVETSSTSTGLFEAKLKRTFVWMKFLLTSRHRLCPHPNSSCLYYSARASIRALFIGYSAQLGLKLFTKAPMLINTKDWSSLWHNLRNIVTDTGLLRIGLFLSTFTGLYKGTNCCLRWTLNSSTSLNCFIAGLVAGPALFIYPSPTVALYVLWKCLEALFNEGVRKKVIKNKDLIIVILYGLATSQLFYSALMDPRYMKKSYMAFLDRISKHKLHMVNRSVLDVFGTEASSGYEDFFPDLHPKFMSKAFLGSIWVWMIEQKLVAKQLSS